MRRVVVVLALTVLVPATLVPIAWAQTAGHFALEDLHLISWEYLPHGHPSHVGAVSSAIVVAWHASHGYPRLLPDLSGDSRIDEDDTVLLAQQFAEVMAPDHRDGVHDPHVVDVLASYVEERYPDAFLMLIFDPSFPDEYHDNIGIPFDSWRYPGLEVLILEDPHHEAYTNLLQEERPGIVGFGFEPEENRYSVGRSFGFQEEPEGWPVDLANTDSGALGPDPVWETMLRWEGNRWWFISPEWVPFEIFIVLVPRDPDWEDPDAPGDDSGDDVIPPGGSWDDGLNSDPTDPRPPGGSSSSSGGDPTTPEPPPGSSTWSGGESSDLAISMFNSGLEPMDAANAAPGEQVRYYLQVWHTGPDIPRNTVAELTIPFGVQIDWIGGNPAEMAGWPGTHFVWSVPEGTLQPAVPADGMTPGVDVWLEEFQITVDENVCKSIEFTFEVSSTTPDPNLENNEGKLIESFGPCDGGSDSGGQPMPNGLPNLWVTNVTGCWDWSSDGREHVMATVSGIVHNGGQTSASGVRVRITAGGVSTTKYVGTISAGGQRSVSATIDAGAYDSVHWPVPTSIIADPSNVIQEGDESNNTANSSFPESNDCG